MIPSLSSSWLNLAGRTAIITGAASGIGASVAKSLSQQGCHVVLADIDEASLAKVADDCVTTVTARTFSCDVSQSDNVADLIRVADESADKEDDGCGMQLPLASILVNCAGITRDAFLSKMEEEDFDDVINVNLRGTFLSCKHFCNPTRLQSFKNYPGSVGSIINLGSVVGRYGNIGQTNYAASKGGVSALTKSLAREVGGQYGVRVNAILPGFIDTPMTRAVPEKVLGMMTKRIVMGRLGEVEDVSDLVLFLASERSRFITGELIECSGMGSL